MKTAYLFGVIAGFICLVSCTEVAPVKDEDPANIDEPVEIQESVKVTDPITVSSPVPTEQIERVVLNDTQACYAKAGNEMAFRFLKGMYNGENLVCSPLSLQYAMAMTANGASGGTLQEILDFLGYGEEGIEALNEYSKILLEQLPAVDLDVTLKVTMQFWQMMNFLFCLLSKRQWKRIITQP